MQKRILLINPSYKSREIVYFPLGLSYVAGACDKAGIEVEFIDMNASCMNNHQIVDIVSKKK